MPESRSSFPLTTIILVGGVLILAVLAWRRQPERRNMGKHHVTVGKEYLPTELPPLTAQKYVKAVDLKGKVVLVNFWGWWCEPCQIEFPHLMELEKSLRSNPDFRFLSISCSGDFGEEDDPELRDKTAAFLSQRGADLPTYIDPWQTELGRIAALGGSESLGYPLTVVIGRDGQIWGLWLGYREGYELQMRSVIDEALK